MRCLILSLVGLVVVVTGQANGAIHDAYEDFGDQQAANGVWHYLEYTGTLYKELTHHETSYDLGPYSSWLGQDGDLNWLPAISKEVGDGLYPNYQHTVFMHPGDNHSRHDAVLRWKAPSSGKVNMSLSVQKPSGSVRGGGGSNGYDVYLEQNGNALLTFPIEALDGQPHLLALPLDVEMDDRIDLRIYNRGPNAYDAALVKWQIEAVPEPSTLVIWSLLATLGIGYGWYRRPNTA